ncbi:MAG: HD-GYP domain-containing protein [Brevinematales bacterium]|jgi:putative nucleotidyltransferase with HDIG domain
MLKDSEFSLDELIDIVNKILNFRDPYTFSHSERVAAVSLLIAREMKLPEKELEIVHYAAHLHDIGKTGIPDSILNKPGRLDKNEVFIIQKHSSIGGTILSRLPMFGEIADIVIHHHERFDGLGYPSNISGKDIPYQSCIIAVADSFDAMTSNRPYRKGLSFEYAREEINSHSGDQFNPGIVDVFNRIAGRIPASVEDIGDTLVSNNTIIDMMFESQDILHSKKI